MSVEDTNVVESDEMSIKAVVKKFKPIIEDTNMGVNVVLDTRFPGKNIFGSDEVSEVLLVAPEELSDMQKKWKDYLSAENKTDSNVYTRTDIAIIAIMMSLSAKGADEHDFKDYFATLMKPDEPHMAS